MFPKIKYPIWQNCFSISLSMCCNVRSLTCAYTVLLAVCFLNVTKMCCNNYYLLCTHTYPHPHTHTPSHPHPHPHTHTPSHPHRGPTTAPPPDETSNGPTCSSSSQKNSKPKLRNGFDSTPPGKVMVVTGPHLRHRPYTLHRLASTEPS